MFYGKFNEKQKKLDEILFYAIRKMSARGVKRAINKGANPQAVLNDMNAMQALAFYDKCYYGKNRSQKLLQNQMLIALNLNHHMVDVDYNKGSKDPALLTFTKSENIAMIQFLVETCHAKVDVSNDQGQTPALWTAMNNNVKMLNYFLKNNADPNALSSDEYKNDYYSILEWVCYQDTFSHDIFQTNKALNKEEIQTRLEIAQSLVKAGANADKVNTQIIVNPQIKTYISFRQEVNATNRKEATKQTITTK